MTRMLPLLRLAGALLLLLAIPVPTPIACFATQDARIAEYSSPLLGGVGVALANARDTNQSPFQAPSEAAYIGSRPCGADSSTCWPVMNRDGNILVGGDGTIACLNQRGDFLWFVRILTGSVYSIEPSDSGVSYVYAEFKSLIGQNERHERSVLLSITDSGQIVVWSVLNGYANTGLYAAPGDVIVCGLEGEGFQALDIRTGNSLWFEDLSINEFLGSVAMDSTQRYYLCVAGEKGPVGQLCAFAPKSGVIWSADLSTSFSEEQFADQTYKQPDENWGPYPYWAQVPVEGPYLTPWGQVVLGLGENVLECFNADGTPVWLKNIRNYGGNMVITARGIFVADPTGRMWLIDPAGQAQLFFDGREYAKAGYANEEYFFTEIGLAIADCNGSLVIGYGKELVMVNRDGAVVWALEMPARVVTRPLILSGGELALRCSDGDLYFVGQNTGEDE